MKTGNSINNSIKTNERERKKVWIESTNKSTTEHGPVRASPLSSIGKHIALSQKTHNKHQTMSGAELNDWRAHVEEQQFCWSRFRRRFQFALNASRHNLKKKFTSAVDFGIVKVKCCRNRLEKLSKEILNYLCVVLFFHWKCLPIRFFSRSLVPLLIKLFSALPRLWFGSRCWMLTESHLKLFSQFPK